MADGQPIPAFSLDGSCSVTENDEETGTPSSTDYEERAGHPAVLAGVQGGTGTGVQGGTGTHNTCEHNGGETGSSKADTPTILVWEGVTYR